MKLQVEMNVEERSRVGNFRARRRRSSTGTATETPSGAGRRGSEPTTRRPGRRKMNAGFKLTQASLIMEDIDAAPIPEYERPADHTLQA